MRWIRVSSQQGTYIRRAVHQIEVSRQLSYASMLWLTEWRRCGWSNMQLNCLRWPAKTTVNFRGHWILRSICPVELAAQFEAFRFLRRHIYEVFLYGLLIHPAWMHLSHHLSCMTGSSNWSVVTLLMLMVYCLKWTKMVVNFCTAVFSHVVDWCGQTALHVFLTLSLLQPADQWLGEWLDVLCRMLLIQCTSPANTPAWNLWASADPCRV